ncbi:MAG TPA: aminotransferase class IV, partial [Candidatus Methylacidiphilales bacterium]|nr:aminotransferase class IV [Candidatus Methylacidiphilales bacterium]
MSTLTGDFAPWLGVFETLRVVDGTPLFVAEHLAEMRRAMAALGIESEFDPEVSRRDLPQASGRWRWMVIPDEARTIFTPETPPVAGPVEMAVSPVRVGSANWDARFKTVSYLVRAQARRLAATGEVVLLNEHGHVASAASLNIFWRKADRLFTPAHEAGCRCGVVRGFVLAQERVEIGHFPLGDLLEADEIFLTNSIRGIVSVSRVEGRNLDSSEAASHLRKAYDAEIARQIAATSSP